MVRCLVFSLLTASVLQGCAPTLEPASPGTDSDAPQDTGDSIINVDTGDTSAWVRGTMVNATDYKQWIFLDLETGETFTDINEESWDVAIRRYIFALRGGVLGKGKVMAVPLPGQVFDDLSMAPPSGYVTDQPDTNDDGVDEYVLGSWYDYDPTTHILSPADIVYAIQADEDHYRFQVLDYYNDVGTSGYPSFQWGPIDGPN
jgi:hypothetical protein